MKKTLFLLFILAATCSFAQDYVFQVTPEKVNRPTLYYDLLNDLVNIREGFTEMKFWEPSVSGSGEAVWYTFNPSYNSSKVLNSYSYGSLSPLNSIFQPTRIKSASQQGNLHVSIIELNEGSQWEDFEIDSIYFDENGKDTLTTISWYEENGYKLIGKKVKTYSPSGKLTKSSIYLINELGKYFENKRRVITYNGNHRTSDLFFNVGENGALNEEAKYEYTYINDKLDSMIFSVKSGIISQMHAYKITLGTDEGINQIKVYQANASTKLEFAYRVVFSGGTAVGLKEVNDTEVTVYPNPVSNHLTIQVKDAGSYSANIIDVQGKVVLNTQVNQEQSTVNVSELSNGLYFLILTDTNGNSYQKRLVISK